LFVGGILFWVIRSQKSVIDIYKDLISANDITKTITLHKRELEQTETITSSNINQLQEQVYELAGFVVHSIFIFEQNEKFVKALGKENDFNKTAWVNLNFPKSIKVIDEIYAFRKQGTDDVRANQ
jgi:hypothetical protein